MKITFKSVAKRFFLSLLLITLACLFATGFKFFQDNSLKLFPKKAEKKTEETKKEDEPSKYNDMSAYGICIDPAFGGSDSGFPGNNRLEKDDNLTLSKKVADILRDEMKFNVYMTRNDDADVSDAERVAVANQNSCAAMITIRRGGYLDSNHAKGFESYIYTGKPENAIKLSDSVLAKLNATNTILAGETSVGMRDSKNKDYPTNESSSMASMVLFAGYVDSDEDNKAFDENLDIIARAIAEGIYDYANSLK